MAGPQHDLDLVDWRRRVGDLYRLRGPDALARFRAGRDHLFQRHPQSPIEPSERAAFSGLSYFPEDAGARVRGRLLPPDGEEEIAVDTGGEDGTIRYRRAGSLLFRWRGGQECRLTVFSIIAYGGGLFLPFRDLTCGQQSYGGGRYLIDTIKNTDGLCLEVEAGSDQVAIDFNYAYNPSCAYQSRWACPLAPAENWLQVAIEAGEKAYQPSA